MRPKNYSERQNWRHQFREQRHEWNKARCKRVVVAVDRHGDANCPLTRARCVFVHVAVSVRLPSPRALRRNAYINQSGGESSDRRRTGRRCFDMFVFGGLSVLLSDIKLQYLT